MNILNKQKNAVVSGGAKGIGSAVAKLLAANGYNLLIPDLNTGQDLTNFSDLQIWLDQQQLTKIDLLINNVGQYLEHTFTNSSPQEWQEVFQNNLFATFNLTNLTLPLIAPSSIIINISSVLGTIPEPHAWSYSCSKAALNMFTKTLSLELAPRGIRVIGIAPGPVQTGISETAEEISGCGCDKLFANDAPTNFTPLKRAATTDEIAELVLFLASDRCPIISGTTIYPDGGECAQGAAWSMLQKYCPKKL